MKRKGNAWKGKSWDGKSRKNKEMKGEVRIDIERKDMACKERKGKE